MVEFYSHYISTTSKARAKLVVQLHAQASKESDEKISELLKGLKLDDDMSQKVKAALSSPEKREKVEVMKSHLLKELKLSADKANAVADTVQQLKIKPKVNGTSNGDTHSGGNGTTPILITDVRDFKASLVASSGARPVKCLSEFEEIDAKL
jgi:insulysin